MALRPYPSFVGPSYTTESKIATFDRTVNWYPEKIESGTGPASYVLYPTPGYSTVVTGLDSPGRGSLSVNGPANSASITSGNLYFVNGGTVYRYPSTVLASGISNGSLSITMVTNGDAGNQLLIASNSTTYCLDLTSNTLTNVGTGHFVAYLDTYGIRLDITRSEISVSDPLDFSTWDPLLVAQRSDQPDPWQMILVHHKELWLFGSETTSVYYNSVTDNTPATDFPFSPITSVFIPYGIVAPRSACVVNGSPMWIGQGKDGSGIVYRANGYTPERVSTHAVELAFRNLGVGFAEGSTYQENGHVFYQVDFPTLVGDGSTGFVANAATWVYDETAGLWHERGNFNGLTYDGLDTRGHAHLGGGQFTFSRSSGTVYLQSLNVSIGTDGLGIRRMRRAPHINEAQRRIRYSRFRLLMETGLGLSTGQGSDPQIALRWSDDGGQTFGSTYTESAGALGAYSKMVEWFQLGQARDRVFELTVSDPISYRLIDAFLDFSVGSS